MADLELKVTIPYTFNVKAAPVQPVTVTPGASNVILVPVPGGKGDKGDTGPAGNNSPIFNETPTGVQDGVNTVFTLTNTYQPGSVRVYLNGMRQRINYSYTESGPAEVTFDDPPLPADDLTIDYLIA